MATVIPVEAFLLPQADRNLVGAEHTGNGVEHAGAVGHVEGEVVRRLEVVDGPDLRLAQPDRSPGTAGGEVVRGVQKVA
jgi:hypothetical protein